ncbi:MAG: invasion associated locus B family protein [Alphaproteobacteria bacterium]|nr:invasion associated locus B family protein [Alphaproteobacteria bacterium]
MCSLSLALDSGIRRNDENWTLQGILHLAVVILLVALTAASPAFAAPKEKDLGAFDAWRAYTYKEGGQTVCYMVTTKTLKSTGPKKRGAPYLMITHRPVEASTDVVSYGAGTMLDEKHGVHLRVGKDSFDLFSVRDTAWARDALTDHKLAAALRAASTVQISGVPAQAGSNAVSDAFDLKGALPAYRAINKACGLPDIESARPVARRKIVKKQRVKPPVAKKPTTAKSAATHAAPKAASGKKRVAKKQTPKKLKLKKSAPLHPPAPKPAPPSPKQEN